jgi:hypothetical protein
VGSAEGVPVARSIRVREPWLALTTHTASQSHLHAEETGAGRCWFTRSGMAQECPTGQEEFHLCDVARGRIPAFLVTNSSWMDVPGPSAQPDADRAGPSRGPFPTRAESLLLDEQARRVSAGERGEADRG